MIVFIAGIYHYSSKQSLPRNVFAKDRYSPKRGSPPTVLLYLYYSVWGPTMTLLAMTVGLDVLPVNYRHPT